MPYTTKYTPRVSYVLFHDNHNVPIRTRNARFWFSLIGTGSSRDLGSTLENTRETKSCEIWKYLRNIYCKHFLLGSQVTFINSARIIRLPRILSRVPDSTRQPTVSGRVSTPRAKKVYVQIWSTEFAQFPCWSGAGRRHSNSGNTGRNIRHPGTSVSSTLSCFSQPSTPETISYIKMRILVFSDGQKPETLS